MCVFRVLFLESVREKKDEGGRIRRRGRLRLKEGDASQQFGKDKEKILDKTKYEGKNVT